MPDIRPVAARDCQQHGRAGHGVRDPHLQFERTGFAFRFQRCVGCHASVMPGCDGRGRNAASIPTSATAASASPQKTSGSPPRSQAGMPASRKIDLSARRGRSDASWKRSPPTRERILTLDARSRAASIPAPCTRAEDQRAVRKRQLRFAVPLHVERCRWAGVQRDAAPVNADLRPGVGHANHGIDAGAAQLIEHGRKARGRRRRQSLAAQEPAQQVARAIRRQFGQCRSRERDAVERQPRIQRGQVVEQPRGFCLVRRRSRQRHIGLRRDLTQYRQHPLSHGVARVLEVDIAFVLDPRQCPVLRVGIHIGARQFEPRAPPADPRGVHAQCGHRRKAVRPGAPQQLQNQRFDLVVPMMGEGNDVGADFACRIGERRISCGAGHGFKAGLRRAVDIHPAHHT